MNKNPALKNILLAAVLASGVLTGCARQYVVTLNNGTQLSVVGKPKEEGNSYVAKDAKGQPVRFSKANVREIAPASMAGSSQSSGIKVSPGK